jgi:hypothetical protein
MMLSLEALPGLYDASVGRYTPTVDLSSRRLVESPGWFLVLGFVAFVVVMAYGVYCASIGGNFHFSYSLWNGFSVACYTH